MRERAGSCRLASCEAASPRHRDSSLTLKSNYAKNVFALWRRPAIWRCPTNRRARRRANSSLCGCDRWGTLDPHHPFPICHNCRTASTASPAELSLRRNPSLRSFHDSQSHCPPCWSRRRCSCVVSCSGSTTLATKAAHRRRPILTWVTSISQHSNGAISRHSPVRVLFTNDVDCRRSASAPTPPPTSRITPAVKMRATFASRREIVLRPEPEFAPGTEYRVSVLREGTHGRARGHQALRVPGEDAGRELRRAHVRPRRRSTTATSS